MSIKEEVRGQYGESNNKREVSNASYWGVCGICARCVFLFEVLGSWDNSDKNEKMILVLIVMGLIVGFLLSVLVLLKFQSAEFEAVGSGLIVGKVYPTGGRNQKAFIRIQMEDGQEVEAE